VQINAVVINRKVLILFLAGGDFKVMNRKKLKIARMP